MYDVNDPVLIQIRPKNLSDSNYRNDIKQIIANSSYHLDEISEMN